MLASPDVAVTNAKDKETILPVVRRVDEHVRQVLIREQRTPALENVERAVGGSAHWAKPHLASSR